MKQGQRKRRCLPWRKECKEKKRFAKSKNSIMETEKKGRMVRGKWECDREAVEQIKVKLSAFTYLDERF